MQHLVPRGVMGVRHDVRDRSHHITHLISPDLISSQLNVTGQRTLLSSVQFRSGMLGLGLGREANLCGASRGPSHLHRQSAPPPNGISIGATVFARLFSVTVIQTHRQRYVETCPHLAVLARSASDAVQ